MNSSLLLHKRVSTSVWKIWQWPLPDLPSPSIERSVSPCLWSDSTSVLTLLRTGDTGTGSCVVNASQASNCWFILQVSVDRMVPRRPLQLMEERVVEMWSQVGALSVLTLSTIPSFFPLCSESDWGCSVLNYCLGQPRLP